MALEAVTIDAYGTLVGLRDPVPGLQGLLRERGVERSRGEVVAAFNAEVEYYVERSHEGRDEATLALLRRECAAVFLRAAGAELDPDEFAPAFVGSLVFEELPGARAACTRLRDAGLRMAVVSNWDVALEEHLRALDLRVGDVVTSAEAGAPKPAVDVFELALERLGVGAAQVVHVGDSEADEEGARRAGLRFEAAPLADAVQRILA